MKSILAALLLFSLPALADPPREIYPSDYKPSPCAAKVTCTSFARVDFASYAGAMRKLDVRQEWVDQHWDELSTAFAPICAKIASCLSAPTNTDWTWCTDFMRPDFMATAERYPKGSFDRDQWTMAALMWFIGLDHGLRVGHQEAQACAAEQPATGERTMDAWITPEKIDSTYDGNLTVYAIDAETHVPVMAAVTVDGQQLKPAEDSPTGKAITYYKFHWPIAYNERRTADGYRELFVPNLLVTAPGYTTATLPMPVELHKLTVEMQPPVAQLKRGTNTVTIVAKDAVTGEPVEMRVLAGQQVLGNTYKPITLDLQRGKKRPEIWITSLFNLYSDVVVAKGE